MSLFKKFRNFFHFSTIESITATKIGQADFLSLIPVSAFSQNPGPLQFVDIYVPVIRHSPYKAGNWHKSDANFRRRLACSLLLPKMELTVAVWCLYCLTARKLISYYTNIVKIFCLTTVSGHFPSARLIAKYRSATSNAFPRFHACPSAEGKFFSSLWIRQVKNLVWSIKNQLKEVNPLSRETGLATNTSLPAVSSENVSDECSELLDKIMSPYLLYSSSHQRIQQPLLSLISNVFATLYTCSLIFQYWVLNIQGRVCFRENQNSITIFTKIYIMLLYL